LANLSHLFLGCGSYAKTQIDEGRSEHWFCSEKEAQEAGWRKALNRLGNFCCFFHACILQNIDKNYQLEFSTPEVPIELRLEQIKQRITEMAQQQAISAGIGSYWQEARRIAQACDMFNLGSHGYDNQSLFVSF